jgi:hypothetical protein
MKPQGYLCGGCTSVHLHWNLNPGGCNSCVAKLAPWHVVLTKLVMDSRYAFILVLELQGLRASEGNDLGSAEGLQMFTEKTTW